MTAPILRVDRNAPCLTGPPDRYYPTKRTSAAATRKVKDECGCCPSLDDCLAWALAHELAGIWGGTSPKDRKRIRRQQGIHLQSVPDLVVVPPHRSAHGGRKSA